MMYDNDQDSNDLCLIDSGVKSLRQVPLRPHLQGLNLHSNYIQTIENLSHLKALKHLDLSSNQISNIEGLEGLYCLRTVNLSCNFLRDVRGLAGLRSLTRLNLSYNQIQDISGFRSLAGPEFKLSHVDLYGNKLTSSQHVVDCMSGCVNLRLLILKQEESSNPVCSQSGYRKAILEGLPQLQYLDNISRSGQPSSGEEVLADIPGLEDYMDYLMSNGNSASSREGHIIDIITPKIDKAIEQFKQRAVLTSTDTNNTLESEPSPRISKTGQTVETEQDKRLKILEQQLAELMHSNQDAKNSTDSSDRIQQRKSSRSPASRKLVAKRDVDQTDESDDPLTAAHGIEAKQRKGKKTRKSRLPSYCKSTAASRARKDNTALSSGPDESSSTSQADLKQHSDHPLPGPLPESRQPTAYCVEDTRLRQDVQTTYVQLMKELENERERRWKSEQATKKLAEHIKEMHTKVRDGDQLKDVAVEATSRLKQALTNEREAKLRLQNDLERMRDLLKETSRQLSVANETEESLKKSLRNMEEVVAKMERDKLQQLTHEQKKSHDSQMKASALGREVEMLRNTTEKQKGQLQQLQELLASREQQHREEMKKCFTPNSQELNDFIQRETTKAEKQYQAELKGQQEKVDQLTRQYSELEDEFRIALQIEATRFKELQDVFQRVSDENSQNKQALSAAQRKDEKSSEMLSELTALVKEQKGRIAELSKSKQEQNADYRERVQTLESHVEEARKRMLQMELLKQDKTKLLAQVEAQESVISGLKAERKLWGQELAQQGASLAQDRGRLEAKIETQMSEISSLKKQLDREADALKIKTKMLEDQTETIRKLKEGLLERDEEVKHAREEALKVQRNLEEQLTEERAVTQDNQETLERLRERKQDLKQQVADLQAELDGSKKAHSILNNKWKEKSQLIGQLEKQVQEMKACWEGKEHKITDERDKAVHAANIAIEKLRSVDDAFRKQLDAKEQKHQEEITLLVQEKQGEIDQAYQRVHAVEQEMRELLKENEASKKVMEDKVKRLTRAMSDLQTDFL